MPSFYVICPWGVFLSWSQGVWLFKVVLCLLLLLSFSLSQLLSLSLAFDISWSCSCHGLCLVFRSPSLAPSASFSLCSSSCVLSQRAVIRSHSFSSSHHSLLMCHKVTDMYLNQKLSSFLHQLWVKYSSKIGQTLISLFYCIYMTDVAIVTYILWHNWEGATGVWWVNFFNYSYQTAKSPFLML